MSFSVILLACSTLVASGWCAVQCRTDDNNTSVSCVLGKTEDPIRIEGGATRLNLRCETFETVVLGRLQHLEELVLEDCKVSTFQGLPNLKRLTLNGAETPPTSSFFLQGLDQLQHLDLTDNHISTIHGDEFCHMTNLQTLNLSLNNLRDFKQVETKECTDLKILDLSRNNLESVALTTLKRLHTLLLQHNNVSHLSGDALTSLRVLNVSHNNLTALPILRPLDQLLVLDLSHNHLPNNGDAFLGLIRLIVLNLSNNHLTRIEPDTFTDLFFLQILDLSRNSISDIVDDSFRPLYNLHTLNLSNNRLQQLGGHVFNGLFVLNKLTLNNNRLTTIHGEAFKNCSDLKELDLSSNLFKNVPHLSDLVFLKTLDLGENRINNATFQGLQQLTGLRLIDNNIGNLTRGMFRDLSNLQVLNLAKNKIQKIERDTFERNVRIEAIRLDGNYLSDIDGVFSTLVTLLWLDLSRNHLSWFDYAFVPSNLKWLDIHANFIEKLGNYYEIRDGIQIRTLDASHNRITEISPLSVPDKVRLLFLNNNRISKVAVATFMDKNELVRVDLYANDLATLEMKLPPAGGPQFYLAGNPFKCDCSMEWLLNNETAVMDRAMATCVLPRGGRAVALTATAPSDYLCTYLTHCFALCHCCEFDACDCEMTCPDNCTCYHDRTWSNNVVDCSRGGHASVPPSLPMDATEVHLDGNTLNNIPDHVFIGRKNAKSLHLNNSVVTLIHPHAFNGLVRLTYLYLHNNRISTISNLTFLPLTSLRVLTLSNNLLSTFQQWPRLSTITLSNNPWSCRCNNLQQLQTWILDKIQDLHLLRCQDDRPFPVNNTCVVVATDYLPAAAVTMATLLPLLLLLLVAFLFREGIRIWLHSKCGIRFESRSKHCTDELYDGYVCYSPKDERFVINTIVAELEPPFQLCLHHRDTQQVLEAVQASRRVILVLTRNFLETEWSRLEFRSALHDALKGRIFKLVLVEEGTTLREAETDPDLRPYLKTGSRVRWGEKRFWERLRYAMPDRGEDDNPKKEDTPRPPSEHIYSSIDSDYSTLERDGSIVVATRGPQQQQQQTRTPWRSGTAVVDTGGVQAYLV